MYHKVIRPASVFGSILRNSHTKIAAITAVLLLVGAVINPPKVLASTGTIYLSPPSQSIQNGNSVTLNLRVTPGTAIDTVSASVSYDASKLSLTGVSCPGS